MTDSSGDARLSKIHLVFKTHLDVGFTDFARNVVSNYFNHYIPSALDVAQRLRSSGASERFVWTTGSWLIYEYLEQAAPDERKRMEEAIAAGDIAWHGLPFTLHSELLDPGLFRFGLSLSQELDQRFGKRTIAAKMTDVPGHTRGIVPLLAEAGLRFLHIGVNAASRPPDVPAVFTWQVGDARIMVMYHKGSYGDLMIVPGLDEAIAFAHTNDNMGPQSPQEVLRIFAEMRARFPNVEVCGSTMDAFAARLQTIGATLPVLTEEIGDTWIHGGGTDPGKLSAFRALQRLRQRWLDEGRVQPGQADFGRFSRFLLQVPEHTWGLDEKTHLNDYSAYERESFQAARKLPNFRKFEASWDEQRGYIRSALEALPAPLADEARAELSAAQPARPNLQGYQLLEDPGVQWASKHFSGRFDPQTGALVRLRQTLSGREWAGAQHPLGLLRYQTFDPLDYDRYYRQYTINKHETAAWSVPDFTKPGITAGSALHAEWLPKLSRLYYRADETGTSFVLHITMPEEPVERFGCPREAYLTLDLPSDLGVSREWKSPRMLIDLQWFDKQACRLPEAIWFSFAPRATNTQGWRLLKLGQAISPREVNRDGNRKLHGVLPGLVFEDERSRMTIDSLDAALVAPGQRSLLDFNRRQPALSGGMHFLLYNNLWGTNFPMWYEEDARFRFSLTFSDQGDTQP